MNYVTFVAEAAWSRETQIRAFAQLREGWHYGEGRGATEKAMATALEVDSRLLACNVHEVEVFPGVDGGILLSVYHENDTLEVRCDPSGRMDMLHEVNDEVVNERHGVSLEKIGAYLEGLEWTPKNSFAYCIQGISASTGEDSQVRPFSRPPAVASRFSIPGALLSIAMANVLISVDTIPALLESPLFSGESIHVFSLRTAGLHVNLQRPETLATETSTVWHAVVAEA